MTQIIAELCQNHLGNRHILDEMVAAAAESGADYAKIQSMKISNLVFRERFEKGLIEGGKTLVIKRPFKKEYNRLKKLDLTDEDHFYFIERCKKYGIKPLTTIFTKERLKFLESLNLETIKISSFDCSSFGLLSDISKSNKIKNVILSTGATYNSEILQAKKILKNKNLTLLHCISVYPTPIELANLNRIKFLKKINKSVGLSDHSNFDESGHKIAAVGLGLGIDIIERHFTILKKDATKDGVVSVNFKELSELVKIIKNNIRIKISKKDKKIILGNEHRELTGPELLNKDYYVGRFASFRNKKPIFNWEYNKI
jgi:sialic acid synthase SpsE